MSPHTRRTVVSTLVISATAGCVTLTGSSEQSGGEPSEDELPDNCPTSRNFDVSWPLTVDRATAEEVATAYEEEFRLARDPSRFAHGSYHPSVEDEATAVDRGYEVPVTVQGTEGSVRMSLLAIEADSDDEPKTESDDEHVRDWVQDVEFPDNPEYVSIEKVEDEWLRDILVSATDEPVDEGVEDAQVDRYADVLSDLSPDVSLLSDSADTEVAYFDVDGTPVLLVIDVIVPGEGDVNGTVLYYVSEYVVRRNVNADGTAESGELLECRLPE